MGYNETDVTTINNILGSRFTFSISDSDKEVSYIYSGNHNNIKCKIIYSDGGIVDFYYLNENNNPPITGYLMDDYFSDFSGLYTYLNSKRNRIMNEFKNLRLSKHLSV
jgi:hypothetical protein